MTFKVVKTVGVEKTEGKHVIGSGGLHIAAINDVLQDTAVKGRYNELVALSAFLLNGWDVCLPVVPRPYDMLAKPLDGDRWLKMQVKTARIRHDRNGEIVVNARKNNGKPYTVDEADYIVAVVVDDVYLIKNVEQSEYWADTNNINEKWLHLPKQGG